MYATDQCSSLSESIFIQRYAYLFLIKISRASSQNQLIFMKILTIAMHAFTAVNFFYWNGKKRLFQKIIGSNSIDCKLCNCKATCYKFMMCWICFFFTICRMNISHEMIQLQFHVNDAWKWQSKEEKTMCHFIVFSRNKNILLLISMFSKCLFFSCIFHFSHWKLFSALFGVEQYQYSMESFRWK